MHPQHQQQGAAGGAIHPPPGSGGLPPLAPQQPPPMNSDLPPHAATAEEELPRVLMALEVVYSATGGGAAAAPRPSRDEAAAAEFDRRDVADRYLTSFQRTPVAWVVCDRLLSSSSSSSPPPPSQTTDAAGRALMQQRRFFAAQTLHAKCRTDVHQLPRDSLTGLRESLWRHFSTNASRAYGGGSHNGAGGAGGKAYDPPDRPLVTRLGMCVASLAVQMDWHSVVHDVLSSDMIGGGGASSGGGGGGGGLHPSQPQPNSELKFWPALELFAVLPEETESDRLVLVDERIRDGFRETLRRSADRIFEFCWNAVVASSGGAGGGGAAAHHQHQQQTQREDGPMSNAVLKCLHLWIRYVDVDPRLLESTPLLPWIFRLLEDYRSDVFESAVDVAVEIVRMYPSDRPSHRGLVGRVVPLVMALGRDDGGSGGGQGGPSPSPASSRAGSPSSVPFRDALSCEDEDGMRGYCRLFTEMGESYMSLIVGHEELNQSSLVELVLRCSAIPDNEIAGITLHFWYRFVAWLESLEPFEFRQMRIDYYAPQLVRLLSVCTSLMRYPPDVDDLSPDRIDDTERDRFYVADAVEDCCRLLGGDAVLRNVGERLREECQRVSSLPHNRQLSEWHGIEACLFAIRAVSRYVPSDENAVMPFVMGLLPQLPSEVPLLRCTANLTIGRYASWLGSHPEYLQPLLPYLAGGLSLPRCASSAAVAIKELCERCNRQLALGDPVLHLYDGIVAARELQQQQQRSGAGGSTAGAGEFVLDLRDELEVLEGACKAVSMHFEDGTTAEAASAYLNRLVQPVGVRLASLAAPDSSAGPNQIIAEIERLTVIVRFLDLPSAATPQQPQQLTKHAFIMSVMNESWQLLDAVSQKHPRDFSIAEKLCRLHKHALRGCGAQSYAPLLEPLVSQLVRNFSQSLLSPYLYAASICIAEFGRDPSRVSLLCNMLTEMSQTVFGALRTPNDFTAHPDVVEEFFFLAGRMMLYCPEPLVTSPLLPSLLQCAAVGMQLDHRDANRGTLNFLENTVSFGLSLGPNPPGNSQACRESLERAIVAEGQTLVTNLAQALLGDLPAYRLDSGSGSIAGVLFKLNALCPELLLRWIDPALMSAPEHAKGAFLSSLVNKVPREEFNSSVRKFTTVCERNRKLHGGASGNISGPSIRQQ